MTNDDWTPVTEGLPENNEDVLIQHQFPGQRVFFTVGHWDLDWDRTLYTDYEHAERELGPAVAWRPIPPPWKGE